MHPGLIHASRLLTVGALVALAACGGGSSGPTSTPTPVPTPTPCVQKVLDSGGGSLPSRYLVYYDFSVPETGRLDITVDWTYSTNGIAIYVVPTNTCTLDELNAHSCNFIVRSESGAKPRKVSAPNVAAGNYRWMFGNYGATDESLSYQVVLSTGNCAPLAGEGPSAASAALPPEAYLSARPAGR
ncbi:MAG: hypothetical protein U0599_25015 [Vicinamibacteria bacterium]